MPGSYWTRNSLGDAKTATAMPAERSKRERAFRTAASSSTTNTVGLRGGSISHSVITASFRARGLGAATLAADASVAVKADPIESFGRREEERIRSNYGQAKMK